MNYKQILTIAIFVVSVFGINFINNVVRVVRMFLLTNMAPFILYSKDSLDKVQRFF